MKESIKKNILESLETYQKINYERISEEFDSLLDNVIGELLDTNKPSVLSLSENDTNIIRHRLGVFNNGELQNYHNLDNLFDRKTDIRLVMFRFFNNIFEKTNDFSFIEPLSKMSAMSLTKKDFKPFFVNYYFDEDVVDFLEWKRIYTLDQLLSYGMADFKQMTKYFTSDQSKIPIIKKKVHSLGLKLIDELSDAERKRVIKTSSLFQIGNSSLSWVGYSSYEDLAYNTYSSIYDIHDIVIYWYQQSMDNDKKQYAYRMGIDVDKIKDIYKYITEDELKSFRLCKISELSRVSYSLSCANIYTVGDLIKQDPNELRNIRGIGDIYTKQIINFIHLNGLHFITEEQTKSKEVSYDDLMMMYKRLKQEKKYLEGKLNFLNEEIAKLLPKIKTGGRRD